MRAARMYGYKEPWRLEEIPVPEIGSEEVLVKVTAAGMCRSDFQLVEGYFQEGLPVSFPITPGHEVAGRIAGVGAEVPRSAGLSEGDLIVVDPNWGDGVCRQCHEGNEQLCGNGQLVGFGPPGGFAEYMAVPHRHVIGVPDIADRKPETLAPLTDAGLTPYRGMKKLRAAGKLGAGRTVVVNGIGGLGGYAVQYARLLGGGATVMGFARSDEKLALARENGAHHTINVRDKTPEEVQNELEDLTGRRDVDAVLDCAGAEESLALGFSILAAEGALTSVGLIGQRAQLSLFPFVSGEKSYFGSFWGNYNDLTEVLSLANEGLIKHNIIPVKLDDINDNLEALGRGDVVGRAVIVYD
ncbi:NAD(P)-dependent alcohol dehydrogenase [Mycobacterium sp. 852002-51057_SCH5723018]|uniref:NAD(P)-dependent alcohol dehydrogenase n=1 Tax=Mycobacterium sp. 852002-51057_SCH5723018 TaxID=1834094 RepID=UPI0007FEE42F|nr:NAD(P)-dependent alcohol dehydrogenase [Mycobacterium sp. 852002-51057_SCH5723018]OBG25289.1 alcohol dehydrogenase [Mycobacterium sp. 852002-51057_SCH5723018]